MSTQRRKPREEDGQTRPTPGATAFARACQRYPRKCPDGHSVAAFVRWIRDNGLARVWVQEDLFLEYLCIQELTSAKPLPLKRFGRALKKAGFPPKQADWEKDGKRWRPMIVDLSVAKPELAVIANRIPISATTDKRVPRLPIETQIAA